MTAGNPSTSQNLPAEAERLSRERQAVLLVIRGWAWTFLVGLNLFFTITISAPSVVAVDVLSLRHSQHILMAAPPSTLM